MPDEFPSTQNGGGNRPLNFLPEHHPKSQRRRIFFVILGLVLVFFGLRAAIGRVVPNRYPNDPAAYDELTGVPKPQGFLRRVGQAVFGGDATLAGERDDRINILLLGQGGPGHDGPYLTDTIIIASIKPSTGQIAMLSVQSDL